MSIRCEIDARLARIAAEDGAINSFIRVDAEAARAAAAAAAVRREQGASLGPLDGLAVAVKDNIAVAGAAWTAGIAGRRSLIAETDAGVVARLRAAGAVLMGGLNMAEAALGAVTDNPAFGRCINPLKAGHTPGGSSGGSAAAVAAGFVDLALGSDTLGSVRLPAAYCGIAAIKPTFGLIGRYGLALLAPSLDTIGLLVADVTLLWPTLQALAGPDGGDPESRIAPEGWSDRPGGADLSGLRFGVPRQIDQVDCEAAVQDGLSRALQAVEALGGCCIPVDLAGWDPGAALRAGLLVTEAEGAVELASLLDRQGALSEHLRGLLLYGRNAASGKLVHALARVRAAGAAAERALAAVDALILPTAPQRAFAHGGNAPANQADFTALANFSGGPAVTLPVALPGENLPASIQLVGPAWSEARLLAWAERLAGPLGAPD